MADIVINPAVGKIDFFSVKGDNVTNTLRLSGNTLLVTGPLSASSISTGGGGAFVTSVQPTSNYLSKFTGNSTIANSVIYDNGTNIGIGTTSPAYKLHVEGTGTQRINVVTTDGASAGSGIYFQVKNAGSLVSNSTLTIDNTGNLKIFTGTSTESERMRVTSTGCVGIGTTSVRLNSLLDVYGSGVFGTSAYGFYVGTDATGTFLDAGTQLIRMFAGQSERMRIATDGNVGIGTSTPLSKLQINTTIAGSTVVRADGTSGTLFSVVDDLTDSLMSVNNSAGLPVFEVFADDRIVGGQYGTNDFVITNNRVGIGTSNPLAELHVTSSTSLPSAAFLGGNVGVGTTSPIYPLDIPAASALTRVGSALIGSWPTTTSLGMFGNSTLDQTNAANYALLQSNQGITYLNAASGQSLRLRIANTDRLIIDSGGNVGIGTTSFVYGSANRGLVELYGSSESLIALRNSTGNLYIQKTSSDVYINNTNSGVMSFATNNTQRMVILAGGSVSFGSSADILGQPGNIYLNGNTGTGAGPALAFGQSDSVTGGIGHLARITGGGTSQDIFIQSQGASNSIGLNANPSGAVIYFQTQGAEKVRITAAGNVGIGTSTPATKLDIYGPVSVRGTTVLTTNFDLNAGNAADIYGNIRVLRGASLNDGMYIGYGGAGGNLKFFSNSGTTEFMTIATTGNVGIGSTSPAAKLDIAGTNTTIALSFGTTVPNNPLFINTYGSNTGIGMDQATAGLRLVGDYGGGTNPLTDIGYYAGGSVSHANWVSRFKVVNSGATVFTANVYHSIGSQRLFAGSGGTHNYIYTGTTTLNFVNAADNSTLMTLLNGGSVGIGTSTPTAKLDVSGGGLSVSGWSNNNSGTTGGVEIGWDGNWGIFQVYDRVNANYEPILINGSYTMFYVSGAERARLNSSGNLGIGTTSPAYKLDVIGDARVSGGIFNASLSAQWIVNGGGTVTYNGSAILWSNRVIVIPVEKDELSTTGYIDINCPTSGTITYYNASNVTTTVTCAASGVPIAAWEALYYEITPGQGQTSDQTKFRLVNYQNSTWKPSSNWILICALNGDSNSLKWIPGQVIIPNNGSFDSSNSTNNWQIAGTTNYVSKFTAANKIGNSVLYDNGTNIGIGTTSPSSKLDVRGNLYVNYGVNGTGYIQTNGSDSDLQITTATNLTTLMNTGGSAGLAFGAGQSERMRIVSSGNIGIGTTIPSSKVHIVQANSEGLYVDGASNYSTVKLLYGGTQKSELVWYNPLNALYLQNFTSTGTFAYYRNGTIDFYISGSGNVGIGTSSPASLLHVGRSSGATATPTAIQMDNSFRNGIGGNTSLKFYLYKSGNESYGFGLNNAGGIEYHVGSSGGGTSNHAFYTDTTEKMRITAAGNVGIGTTSPSTKLDVAGTINISNGSANLRRLSFDASGVYYNWIESGGSAGAGYMAFAAGNSESMRIITGGNIGIGTTSPTAKFQVGTHSTGDAGNGDNSANVRIGASSAGARVYGMTLANTATATLSNESALSFVLAGNYSATSVISAVLRSTVNAATDLVFTNYSGGLQERMRILYDGNVGIGTTSPSTKLHIYENANRVTYISQNDNHTARFEAYGTATAIDTTASNGIFFRINSGDIVKFAADGNVGIGTSTAGAPLHIYRASNPWIRLNGGGNFAYIRFDDGTSNGYLFKNTSSDTTNGALAGAMYTYTDSGKAFQHIHAGTPLFTILSGGNVGIGTTSPLTLLDVRNGYITAGTAVSTSGTTILAGYYTSGTLTVLGTEYSSGGPVLGYAVSPSTSATGAFLSSTTITIPRSAYVQDGGTHRWYTGAAQTVAIGSAVSTSERMRINSDGNLGIGTSTPRQILHLNGSILLDGLQNGYEQGSTRAIGYGSNSGAVNTDGFSGMDIQSVNAPAPNGGNYSQNLRFWTHHYGTGTGNTPRMVIQYNGNVGIGTTAPSATLTVIATNNTGSRIQLGTASNNTFMDANKVNDFMVFTAPFGASPASVSNGGAKWGIKMNGSIDTINTKAKSAAVYAVSEETNAGYNRQVGLALHTSGFDLENSEKVRITAGGNVGIGTTNPATLLHVDTAGADARIRVSAGTNTVQGGMIANTNGLVYAGSITNHGFSLRTNDTDRVRIQTDGNVGIGTTSPSSKLEVGNFLDAVTNKIIVSARYEYQPEFNFRLGQSGTNLDWIGGVISCGDDGNYNGVINFKTANAGRDTPTTKMVIKASGNVGIGLTTPSALLNIRASTPTTTGTVPTGTNVLIDSNTSNYITFRNTGDNGTYAGLIFLDNNVGGYISFRNYTADGVAAGSDCMIYGSFQDHIFQNGYVNETLYNRTETMRIKSSGYVGINTNNPTARLQVVQGNSGGVAAILLSSDESTIQGPSANTQIRMGSNLVLNASGIIPIGTNGSEKMRIQSDGNVGIGTTSPIYKFQVVGSTYVNNGTLFIDSGNILSWGNSAQYILGTNGVGLTFVAGSATRMFVSSTGNVGIGTTTPSGQLHVNSTTAGSTVVRADGTSGTLFSVVDDLTDSLMSVNNSAGLPVFEVFADDRIVGGQYGANDFVITNNRVGIGTSNPLAELHVTGSASVPAAVFYGNVGIGTSTFSYPTSNRGLLELYGNADSLLALRSAGTNFYIHKPGVDCYIVNTNSGFISIYNNGSERMCIRSDGKVGIGTSSPNSQLTILGDGTQNNVSGVLRIADAGSSKWGSIGLPDVQSTTTAANNFYLIGRGGAFTDRILSIHIPNATDYGSGAQPKFGVYSTGADLLASVEASTGTSYFKGNVGIGSASPTQKLDVNGSIYTSGKLVQRSATQSLSGTTGCTIDLANGVVHILSLANATTISSFTYNSRDNNPSVNTLMLVVKYAGTASITFTNVIWANGATPTLTGTNGYADVFMLTSYQGGAGTPVWIGTVVAQALVSTNL